MTHPAFDRAGLVLTQRYIMKKIYIFTVVLLATLLSACGFHLKGQMQNSSNIHAIYLDCKCDDAMAQNIVSQLQARDIYLMSDPANGLALTISNAGERSFNTAIGDNDRSKEVELSMGFDAQVERDGQFLGKRRIESSAYVQYNSNTYLGSNAEAAETRGRLQRDNIDKLIRFLESLSAK